MVLINTSEWGQITIGLVTYKDAKACFDGHCEWNWNECGTNHRTGISLKALSWLLNNQVHHLILSTGFHRAIQVNSSTVAYLDQLKSTGIIDQYEYLDTKLAVGRYNHLIKSGVSAGILIHST